jgi:hypothetical protein
MNNIKLYIELDTDEWLHMCVCVCVCVTLGIINMAVTMWISNHCWIRMRQLASRALRSDRPLSASTKWYLHMSEMRL